ncbi:serine-threonine/tyrosine-protein kinase catalytic domain-containing protein [Artemisia annua]|uniref:Serine-threonine/tyrosine-protein kinase catalytic domain-containing protein n=1 Tax=Artemisia annua TaxID=35608 RepID=A0A2U1MBV1_ARTAN|nr:serine-threonine/tyrosine-protein kinase catalytic domain-containing protein [Artemisia annua]
MSLLKGSQHLRLSLKEVELATKNFSEPIGKGGYGMVYKGELPISGRPTTVAVKRLNETSGQGLKEFLTEIQLLSGQNHKNVVSLLGYCDEGKEKSLIYEYAANGSLDVHIKNRDTSLNWRKRLEICLDAARGLNHLHSNSKNKQTIIHRDIKSANILLDQNWVAKIADLGLSKLNFESSEGSSIVSNACGTPGYCDPGYYNGILKKECDVYSFGIVLFEVLCGKLCSPYPNKDSSFFFLSGPSVQKYYKENKMKEIIDPCLKEQMSSYSISKFSEVAYKCLLKDERKRHSMNDIMRVLEELLFILSMRSKRALGFGDYIGPDEIYDPNELSTLDPEPPLQFQTPVKFVREGEMHTVSPTITGTFMPTSPHLDLVESQIETGNKSTDLPDSSNEDESSRLH